MQDRKMTNPTDGINETNKKLRQIYEQVCCLSSSYNKLNVVSLSSSDSLGFGPGELHSITWEIGSGATLRIETDTDPPVSFTNNGSITFSGLNSNLVQFTATGGSVDLLYITP
jgi:hypothetical protein